MAPDQDTHREHAAQRQAIIAEIVRTHAGAPIDEHHGPPARADGRRAGCSRRRASGSRRWRATPPPGGPTSRATRRWPTPARTSRRCTPTPHPRSEGQEREERRRRPPGAAGGGPSLSSPPHRGGWRRPGPRRRPVASRRTRRTEPRKDPVVPKPPLPGRGRSDAGTPQPRGHRLQPTGRPARVGRDVVPLRERADPGQHGRGPTPAGLPARGPPGQPDGHGPRRLVHPRQRAGPDRRRSRTTPTWSTSTGSRATTPAGLPHP